MGRLRVPDLGLRGRAVGASWATGLMVLVVSVLGLWPFAQGLWRGEVPGQQDIPIDGGHGLYLYTLFGEVVAGRTSLLQTDAMWFPTGRPLLLVVQNFVDAALSQPFFGLFAPQTALALFSVLVLVSNGLAGGWAGAKIGGRWGAVAAALVMVMSPYVWGEVQTGRTAQALMAPMVLAVGCAWETAATGRGGWKAGVWLGITGLCYWFYAVFTAVVVGGLLFGAAWERGRGMVRQLAIAAVVSAAIAAPFVIFSGLNWGEMAGTALLVNPIPNATQLLGGWFWLPHSRIVAYLPQALFGIGLVACVGAPRGRAVGLAIAAGILCWMALGETTQVWGHSVPTPLWLLKQLPGFSRFWWPHRALAGAQVALAVLAALAMAQPNWRRAVATVGLVLVVGQGVGVPGPLTTWRVPPKPVWVDELPPGALLFLPMLDPEVGKARFAEWTWVRRPLVNGMSMWDEYLWPESWREWAKGQPLVSALLQVEKARPHGRKKPNPHSFKVRVTNAVEVPSVPTDAAARLAADGVGSIVAEMRRTPPASLAILEAAVGPGTCEPSGRTCWWKLELP